MVVVTTWDIREEEEVKILASSFSDEKSTMTLNYYLNH